MRRFALLVAAFLPVALLAALTACSGPAPPVGRWQAVYEGDDLMIAARLEIAPDGALRVSAPNAFGDFIRMSDAERGAIRDRLEQSLALAWSNVLPIELAFDGEAFRKPGGVAPQLQWDAKARQMTLVFYSGTHPAVHVPLEPVENFSD